MKTIKRLATLIALVSAGMSALLLVKARAPRGFLLWMPKLFAGALAPFFGIAGLVGAVVGLLSGAKLAVIAGLFSLRTAWNFLEGAVRRPQEEMDARFGRAFGPQWQEALAKKTGPEQKGAMLPWRWTWFAAPDPAPRVQKDVPFWTDPEGGRRLLCDLWLPPEGIPPTGLGIVYFHGSAWYLGDKDFGTRELFRHLAAQGHAVMDAQYRLAPETDMFGMIQDVKRAIAWCKTNAVQYGIDPQRIVPAGGSAGGQLALLAAYAPNHPALTPADLLDRDLSVHGVVSYYGPCDLAACYYHTNQHLTPLAKVQAQTENQSFGRSMGGFIQLFRKDAAQTEEMLKKYSTMSMAGRLEPVLGGSPDETPENYRLASPISHVSPACPPTFLAQGADDLIVPIEATQRLFDCLVEAGVPVVNLVLPQVDHGFDLVLQRTSPPAQSALYELDRFLALL